MQKAHEINSSIESTEVESVGLIGDAYDVIPIKTNCPHRLLRAGQVDPLTVPFGHTPHTE